DDFQGRGIGTRMLEQLAAAASAQAIEEFVAEVMADNAPMLRVFADAGFEVTRATAFGETEVRLKLESTEAFRSHVDERDHVAVAARRSATSTPRSWSHPGR